MEAGADFEEGADAAGNLGPAGGGASDAGKDFEKSGLAGAVAADEAEDFAFFHFQGDILQRPESFVLRAAEDGERRADESLKGMPQTGFGLEATMVALAEAFAVNDSGHGRVASMKEKDLTQRTRRTQRAQRREGAMYCAPTREKTVAGLDSVGNGGLHAIEEEEAAEDDEGDDGAGSKQEQAGGLAAAGDGPAEAVNDAGHGIEAVEPAPARGNERGRIGDGRSEHPELDEERNDV